MNFKKLTVILAAMMTLVTPVIASADTMTVTAPSGLNVRTGEGTDSQKLGALPYGAEINVIETTNKNWAKVIYNNTEAYMFANWLRADQQGSEKVQKNVTSVAQSNNSDNSKSNQASGNYYGKCKITFYCPCAKCCSRANQPTASGVMPSAGRTVAMSGLPFGTKVSIDGHVYTVEDRGVSGKSADIFVNSHSEALQRGMHYSNVYIVG